ncbi:MAG: hypothetical protein ABI685_01795 [Ferruginibacter sp.]
MKINKTLETAAFSGITAIFVAGFFIYVYILQQVVNVIMHLPVITIQQ